METENHTGSSADKPIGPGTRLNDIFEIDEKIATGGMGEVFRGHNITTDEAVAIKIVLGEFARDEKYSNLFFKEAKVLSSLNHPSIVRYQIFTVDKTVGRPYLVMEYIEGMSLAERLGHGPLSVGEVRRLTARLADGLETAHVAGVVHRDLSPDNILLSNNDVAQPKLIDFGIARTTQAGHKTFLAGEFAGRTNFASPEQFGLFGGNVEAASDVYSLGLVVINALQGAPLDMNGTQYEMIEKRRGIPDLSHLDADLRPIVEAMLVPDPAARHLTMADVAGYFSSRKPLDDLKRQPEPAPASAPGDADDFWLAAPAGAVSSVPPPEPQPAKPNATIIAASREDIAAGGPEPDKRQPAPVNETIIASASLPPQPETQSPFELPATEAKPIIWESQPVSAAPPAAALPVRKRSAWPYALTASVLILAAGGAGAVYSGALKNILPPELDALLHGKSTTAKKTDVAQDDLPDLTAQPDKTAKTKDHVATETPVKVQKKVDMAATHVTENDTVKQKTDAGLTVTSPNKDKDTTRLKPAITIKPTSDKSGQNQQATTASNQNKPVQNTDKLATEVANATTADTTRTEITNGNTSVLPDNTVKHDTLRKKENTVQTVTHGHETEVSTTDQKTESSTDTHKAETTTDNQNENSATETDKDDNGLGGVLPDDKQDTVAQDKQPTDDAGQQTSNDTAVKPKNNDALAHDTNASAEATNPVANDVSKQASDQTSGKLGNEENLSTAGKPIDVKKNDDTAQAKHPDQNSSDITAGKPASTTSHEETVTMTDDLAKKNTSADAHVATKVTTPVKTEDTENETNEEANTGLPSDVLPPETGVKHTSTDATSDSTAQTVHNDVKRADTAIAHPETDQSSDTANENKTGHETDLNNNADVVNDTGTKPSDATADDGQQPASDDNGVETENTDNSTEQTELATSKTDQATKDTDVKPSVNDNGEDTAKIDDNAQTTDQATIKTDQTNDTIADSGLPSDNNSHVDEGTNNPVDTTQTDNGGQSTEPVKDQSTKVDNTDSTVTANSSDTTQGKPAVQSKETQVAVGDPTAEMKHPEISVEEGLAKRDSWVAGFEAGDCFYATMTTNVASAAGIVAVAAENQPFFTLNDSFTSTFGLEPALRGVPIDKRQCAVAPLLRQLRQAQNEALDLKLIPTDEVLSGEPVSSHVTGIAKPVRTIYLIDNDGRVYDLSKDVRKKTGPDIDFDYRGREAKSNAKTFKVLLLIVSDEPLAIDFPKKPPEAKNIIPKIAKAINLQPSGVQYAYGFFKVVDKTN